MCFYRVQLLGRNFRLTDSSRQLPCTFTTGIDLHAESAEMAERDALAALRNHPQLGQRVCNPIDDPPLIFSEVQEIPPPSQPVDDTAFPRLDFSFEEPLNSPFALDELLD